MKLNLDLFLQGFSAAVDAIVQNLPSMRQTLLFSATQKQSVRHRPTFRDIFCKSKVPGIRYRYTISGHFWQQIDIISLFALSCCAEAIWMPQPVRASRIVPYSMTLTNKHLSSFIHLFH